jgi:hypothetical protein
MAEDAEVFPGGDAGLEGGEAGVAVLVEGLLVDGRDAVAARSGCSPAPRTPRR